MTLKSLAQDRVRVTVKFVTEIFVYQRTFYPSEANDLHDKLLLFVNKECFLFICVICEGCLLLFSFL